MNGPPPPIGVDCKVTFEPTQTVLLGAIAADEVNVAPAVIATVPVAEQPKAVVAVTV